MGSEFNYNKRLYFYSLGSSLKASRILCLPLTQTFREIGDQELDIQVRFLLMALE